MKQYLGPIQQCFDEKFENLGHFKNESTFKRCLSKLSIDDVKSAIKRAEKITKYNIENKKLIKFSGYSYYYENPALSINEVVKKIFIECGII